MSQHFLRILIAVLLVSCFGSVRCIARGLRTWSYTQLVDASDLVAIIEPIENQPAQDDFVGEAYGHPKSDFSATDTRFRVHSVFKSRGNSPEEITVLHFSYSTHVQGVADGAIFIKFLIGPLQYEKRDLKDEKPVGGVTVFHEPPVWLAFLKHRADGRYEPVTGHFDSGLSFREIHRASFYTFP
jgi:hypothetical protein